VSEKCSSQFRRVRAEIVNEDGVEFGSMSTRTKSVAARFRVCFLVIPEISVMPLLCYIVYGGWN
jgi:hypothetical protein